MITVKNAESYLKNKIGKDTDDIKKVWETFKKKKQYTFMKVKKAKTGESLIFSYQQ